jgi:hypothetical protein
MHSKGISENEVFREGARGEAPLNLTRLRRTAFPMNQKIIKEKGGHYHASQS